MESVLQKPVVAVAMSGGVDSSVAAALLKEQGYPVFGLMLRLWNEPRKERENQCCTPDAVAQARRVAARLGFPFYVIDARDVFHKTVVMDFIDGYRNGITPNPCMLCNRQIRWGFLLENAKTLGAERMATGHYARLQRTEEGRVQLLRARDDKKDQSYVLSRLEQPQLERSVFPLGDYCKEEVREIAERFQLGVAHKKESQDLCFLGKSDYRDFLERNIPEIRNPGEIRNRKGELLGRHDGLAAYTIGQRRGINVGAGKPLYVLEKDLENNLLIVGEEDELSFRELTAGDANWIAGAPPANGMRVQAKIRYRAAFAPAVVKRVGRNTFRVVFDEPLRDITPGQYVVLYDGDIVLGSGVILPPRVEGQL